MRDLQLSTLGDYTLLKKIGEGMLGTVFLAEHRFLKTPFALKVLPESLASHEPFLTRLEQEVGMLAELDHPHILKLHNVCEADGKVFLVYDCMVDHEGNSKNLAQYLEENPRLSEAQIGLIARQVASALDEAHAKNVGDAPIVHRGLKLRNILINPLAEEPLEVKVSDFGLTRIVGIGAVLSRTYRTLWEKVAFGAGFEPIDTGEEESKLYATFTDYYQFLAPEQRSRLATARDVDAKADVYAFGILLYFLLVGEYPAGFFPMPSECNLSLKGNWDPLIKQTLNIDPDKRPSQLFPLVEEATRSAGMELRPFLHPQEIARPAYEADPAAVFQIDKEVAIYTPIKHEVKEVEPLLTEMAVIPGGDYLRGSNHGGRDEMPRHTVHLSSFAMDIHPVTNEQFVRFLSVMGGEKDVNNNDMIRLRDSRIRRQRDKLIIESGYAKHPVVGVTWYGAFAYAKWIGKRLPTEAEWEVAAYGGLEGAEYPTGASIEKSHANFFSADTTAVKSYPSNGLGLYDIAGNVYEWCLDWYGYHYYETSLQEPDNPQGPPQGVYRVLRGGCWKSLKEDMRCSHRHRNNPGMLNGTYGFRCAADVIES